MSKKSLLSMILACLLVVTLFAGCGSSGSQAKSEAKSAAAAAASEAKSAAAAAVSEAKSEAAAAVSEAKSEAAAAVSEAKSEAAPAANVDTSKESIKVGAVRSQTGVFAMFDQTAFGPCYRMWVDKVNADGGIYVEEYGKKLPIDLIVYDDTSDMNQMTQLYQKLILEDQVDFLLPPVSTAFLSAAVPIAAQYGYLMIGAEGGSDTLKEALAKYPDFFSVLNYSVTQVPAIVDLMLEQGMKSAYIVYIQDTHGIEYSSAAEPAFKEAGIEIKAMKSVPADLADVTPIINDAMASGADAFILFTYPQITYPAIEVSKALGYNPKMFITGPGGSFESMKAACGGDAGIEGIIFEGAWNDKGSPEAAQFAKDLQEFNKDDPAFGMDWWGHIVYYASLEVLQQAIEGAGTLDNKVISQYIKDNHFNVSMGEIWFENQEIAHECFLGDLGQWQNGYPEVIDADENRTADPIVPKPEWAKQ